MRLIPFHRDTALSVALLRRGDWCVDDNRRMRWGAASSLVFLTMAFGFGLAQETAGPDEVIDALKTYERSLGLRDTHNFQRRSGAEAASYRCYYTGKLELPATYDGLELRQVDARGCAVDEQKYDTFFYAIEAVASGDTPVTSGLEKASTERLLVVVPHEDMHAAEELRGLGVALNEAATTLIAFRTAAEFAKTRYGEMSGAYDRLAHEADLFLAKANIINRYWTELSGLYAGVTAGRTPAPQALAAKSTAFARLRRECEAIQPKPASFNACPAAENNAGLAFDMTYARYYPLVYELWLLEGRDIRRTLDTLAQAGREHRSEAAIADALRVTVARLRAERGQGSVGQFGNGS